MRFEWLRLKCCLVTMEIMTETIINFAKENGYLIEELNKSQKEKIKLILDRAFLKERRQVAETIFF